ncbi:MAG: ribulose-phosphate 3-epimerase [Eubacteriales bacterium]|nr:ribulose-phosphate 3-epimerase [Eubacteriales bacterium]
MAESSKQAQLLLTTQTPLIAPSLLAADFSKLAQEIQAVADADALHLDIMDGHFVPNISYGPGIVKQVRPLWDKVLDVHLMVDRPEDWLQPFAQAGADLIVFHLEAAKHPHRLLQEIHGLGCLAGISLNPGTPVQLVQDLLPFLDHILLMTVNPGFGGQSYIAEMESKIGQARQMISQSGRPILLQVDGGIKSSTIAGAAAAGANFFVAGTAVFKSADPAAEIAKLRHLAAIHGCGGQAATSTLL